LNGTRTDHEGNRNTAIASDITCHKAHAPTATTRTVGANTAPNLAQYVLNDDVVLLIAEPDGIPASLNFLKRISLDPQCNHLNMTPYA
jgi:hypothetical protein